MKLQKIILCVAIALTAFGASLGLLEIGSYIRTAFAPAINVEVKPLAPVQPPVIYPQRIPDFAQPIFTPTEESEPVEEPEDWGATGDYYIIDERPKGFENFLILDITDHEYDEESKKVVKIKPEGLIRIENREAVKDFEFSRIKINGKRISLATEKKKGVSYQFNGKFIEEDVRLKDENGEFYTETVYLKGRLTKWRDGKKIDEAKVRFSISHGC